MRAPWLLHPRLATASFALIVCGMLLVFGPWHLADPGDVCLALGAVISTWVLPASLSWRRASWPARALPFRASLLLALASFSLIAWGCFLFWLATGAAGVEDHQVGLPDGRQVRVIGRGNFGGTWQDVVLRERLLGPIVRDRHLAQFDAEGVVAIQVLSRQAVELELAGWGRPSRRLTLALPGPGH